MIQALPRAQLASNPPEVRSALGLARSWEVDFVYSVSSRSDLSGLIPNTRRRHDGAERLAQVPTGTTDDKQRKLRARGARTVTHMRLISHDGMSRPCCYASNAQDERKMAEHIAASVIVVQEALFL